MLAPMRRRRPSLAVVLAAAIFLPAAGLRAEDAPRPPPSRRGDGFKFSPPDPTGPAPAETPPAGPVEPGAPPVAGGADVAPIIRRLATWPGPDGIRAAESLVLLGTEVVDPVLQALTRGEAGLRPGAAWVLGKVGSRDHVPAILRAAAESRSGIRLETFFEAAYELDVALTKKWLFSFLTLERPVFRARATEFLAGIVVPEDRPRIDGLIHAPARQPGVRIAGLELLLRTKAPDAAERLLAALGDPHPDVARRAAVLVAGAAVEDETLLPRLNSLARETEARSRSYAVLGLVEHNRRARKNGFDAETVRALTGRRGLLHPDRLVRSTSAVGLAFGALDSTDPAVGPLLDRDVVSVLIETTGGDHFLDYGSVVEPAFAALRRLSGLDLPPTASPWAQWWLERMEGFRARRTLAGVAPADIPHSRVMFDAVDAEGRRRRAAFVPEAPGGGTRPKDAFVLPLPAFQALVDGIEDAGIFAQPDDPRTLADEHLAVRLAVMNQEKRMLLVPSRDDPRHGTLMARLDALEETNLWQSYRDVDVHADEAAWWKAQRAFFAEAAPAARREALAQMVTASFDDLASDAERGEALDLLERRGAEVTDAGLAALLTYAASAPAFGDVESRLVKWVTGLDRPALAEPTVEALARAGSPEAARLLADTLAGAGPQRVREAMADPRPGVRSASALATADLLSGPMGRDPTVRARLGTTLEPGLRALLVDPDPIVKARAAASLQILGDGTMLDRLEDVYREGDAAVRIAVAESYGRIGGSAVQPLLVRIVGEVGVENAPVRAAALAAMAASRHEDAVRIIAFYMLNDADAGVQQAAESSLTGLADEGARQALLDLLATETLPPERKVRVLRALASFEGPAVHAALGRNLEDGDPRVVDQAALGLAAQRDAAAVPYLVAILRRPEEPLRPKAVEALQDLTSVTLLVASYEAAADQYEAWFRQHRTGNDRSWFRDAVAKRGYDTTALAGYLRGESDLGAVPVLLRTIRDDDPVLRRNSDLALRRVTGHEPARRLDRTASREESERIADRWVSWVGRNPSGRTK